MNKSNALYNSMWEVGFEALLLPSHLDELPSIVKGMQPWHPAVIWSVIEKKCCRLSCPSANNDDKKHTFRSLQAMKKATHLIAAGQREGPFLWVFSVFPGIKSTTAALGWYIELGLVLSISRNENGWCLGKSGASHASQGCAGASERDSLLRLGNRSSNLLDHVSCSGRPLGCPVYSLRATWSPTAANAFLAGLKRSLRTLPEQQGPPLRVFK